MKAGNLLNSETSFMQGETTIVKCQLGKHYTEAWCTFCGRVGPSNTHVHITVKDQRQVVLGHGKEG